MGGSSGEAFRNEAQRVETTSGSSSGRRGSGRYWCSGWRKQGLLECCLECSHRQQRDSDRSGTTGKLAQHVEDDEIQLADMQNCDRADTSDSQGKDTMSAREHNKHVYAAVRLVRQRTFGARLRIAKYS